LNARGFEDVRQAHGPRGPALPPAYWAYWVLLIASCGLEFCNLFWAPAYLERVVGFAPAIAAAAAAGFPLGMLLGRIALRFLVRRAALRRLLIIALTLVFIGFVIYWGLSAEIAGPLGRAAAILGVFLIGLGVAPLYPLTTYFAVGAAPLNRDRASMRLAIAIGLALLLAPIALGALADEVGLAHAHLALPAIIAVAFASFFSGQMLEKRVAVAV
jgi:fucose permease